MSGKKDKSQIQVTLTTNNGPARFILNQERPCAIIAGGSTSKSQQLLGMIMNLMALKYCKEEFHVFYQDCTCYKRYDIPDDWLCVNNATVPQVLSVLDILNAVVYSRELLLEKQGFRTPEQYNSVQTEGKILKPYLYVLHCNVDVLNDGKVAEQLDKLMSIGRRVWMRVLLVIDDRTTCSVPTYVRDNCKTIIQVKRDGDLQVYYAPIEYAVSPRVNPNIFMGVSMEDGRRYELGSRDVHGIIRGKTNEEVREVLNWTLDNISYNHGDDIQVLIVSEIKDAVYEHRREELDETWVYDEYESYGAVFNALCATKDTIDIRYEALEQEGLKSADEYNLRYPDRPMSPALLVLVCEASGVVGVLYKELLTEILKKCRVTDVHVLLAVVESNGVMVPEDIHEACTLHIGKSKDDLYEITSTLRAE